MTQSPALGMIQTRNKALFHRWFGQVWNEGHYEVAHEVISPKMRVHGAGGQPVEQGPDGLAALIRTWRDAFPDGHMYSSALIAEGDLVAALLTWRGTQQAEFYGAPASGRTVACTSIGIDRIENGIIVDGWGELDMVGMMQQLEALPAAGPGASAKGESAEWGSPDEVVAGPASGQEKEVAQEFIEALNSGDLGPVLAEGYREYGPVYGASDAAGAQQILSDLKSALPDLHYRTDPQLTISEGDLVVVHGVLSGHHNGTALWGAEPSNTEIAWTQTDLLRIKGSRITERWVCTDNMALLTQMKVIGGTS